MEYQRHICWFEFACDAELSPRLWSLWPQLHALIMDFGIDYWENILIPLDNFISRCEIEVLSILSLSRCPECGAVLADYQACSWLTERFAKNMILQCKCHRQE